MGLILVDNLRYLFGALFIFLSYFSNEEKTNFKRYNFKKLSLFLCSYLPTIMLVRYFFEGPAVICFSVLVVFIFTLLDAKNIEKWRFCLVYSVFINSFVECLHITIHILVVFLAQLIGISKETHDANLALFRAIICILLLIVLFLIFKFGTIDIEVIRRLSKNVMMPVIFMLIFSMIIYMKYSFKNTDMDEIYHTIVRTFLFFSTVLFNIFLAVHRTLSVKHKQLLDLVINDPDLNKNLIFDPKKHKKDKEFFENELIEMKVDHSNFRFGQYVCFLVVLKAYPPGEKVNIKTGILFYIAKYLNKSTDTIVSNCTNIIVKIWKNNFNFNKEKAEEFFEKRYGKYKIPFPEYDVYPSLKKFSDYMVKIARKKESELK